jgi:hypothetical protein
MAFCAAAFGVSAADARPATKKLAASAIVIDFLDFLSIACLLLRV